MDDKVHQLVFIHLFCVEVGDEEADVIALKCTKEEVRKHGNISLLASLTHYVAFQKIFHNLQK